MYNNLKNEWELNPRDPNKIQTDEKRRIARDKFLEDTDDMDLERETSYLNAYLDETAPEKKDVLNAAYDTLSREESYDPFQTRRNNKLIRAVVSYTVSDADRDTTKRLSFYIKSGLNV